jgi:hypothetical protein
VIVGVDEQEVAYHLLVDGEEAQIAARALRLLIADEAHQPHIRELARSVSAHLDAGDATAGPLSVPLSAPEMKIVHTALRLLLGDLGHGQEAERKLLWQLLEKLPDEHSINAIAIE